MKAFIKIYKALLLYTTVFSICTFLLGAESIYEISHKAFFVWIIMNILFVWMCKSLLTYKDFYKLSGMALLDKLLGK